MTFSRCDHTPRSPPPQVDSIASSSLSSPRRRTGWRWMVEGGVQGNSWEVAWRVGYNQSTYIDDATPTSTINLSSI